MKTFIRIFCWIVFLDATCFQIIFPHSQNILTYLPLRCELREWDQKDSTRICVGEDLFTLIDGGADIYLEYGFRQVAAAEYRNTHENSIKVEIYEMSDASAAYGMFSLNTRIRGKKVQIGNEGMLFDYYLMFWKNTFLVYLTGADTAGETISGILSLAESIDQRLGTPGTPPELVSSLPKEGLQSNTYIRGNIGLSSFYTFDAKNIFEMKEGVIGTYPTHTLFIFQYHSDKEAEDIFVKAQEVLKTSNRYSDFKKLAKCGIMTDQKGAQMCVTYTKNFIVIALSKERNGALVICDTVIRSLQSR